MRNNQPVTQQEYKLPEGVTLMSTTDVQSHVTYANTAFVQVSGFDPDEIVGQPHNFIRHPDMPKEAFADMWTTLKGGEPWTGLVKNRRKNGDHYWVRANAVPVIRNGRHEGYMSVRLQASREEIEGADALYREVREGRAGSRQFYKGLVIRSGVLGLWSRVRTLSVRSRIRLNLAGVWLLLVLGAGFLAPDAASLLKVCGIGAAAAVLLAFLLESQIAGPLEALRKQSLAVATGENRNVVQFDRVDEIGMTLRTVSQLGLMFRWLIDDVSVQMREVLTAVTEIAQGNNDLSARTEQAAASVEETASSMEQMMASVKNNADTARQANQLSASASGAASKGGESVSEMVNTMSEISASSRKIEDIISIIDGIAFQTNILALNAAVEAARAGEQGRGFAVVASEVRSLAQRSANAAKEIKTLIGASASRVDVGSHLADAAGQSMGDIVAQVKRVSDLIGEISSATSEQSSGIAQVGQAVSHLDQITQQNAALVEQSAAASTSLQQLMGQLVAAVNVFR